MTLAMQLDPMTVALRVLNAITRGHMPTQHDQDALKLWVADEDQEIPVQAMARLIVNRELLKQNSAMERQVTKMA